MTPRVRSRRAHADARRSSAQPMLPVEGGQWDHVLLDDAHPWTRACLSPRRTPPSRAYRVLKRLVDVTVATFFLMLTLPALLVLALAVKLEHPSAPVLFCQQRTGVGGRPFRMFKFRSMRPPTADDLLRDVQLPPGAKDAYNPRITRLGRFLRRSSLDELPQLLNVVRGDMSLVGPRPTSLTASAHELWQTERLEVKPGLTGLWQIVARGAVSFPNRCRLDIAYARRPSLRFDLEILLRSVPAVLLGRGAR